MGRAKPVEKELSEPAPRDLRKGRHGVVLFDARKMQVSELKNVLARLDLCDAQVWLVDAWTGRGGDLVLWSGVDELPSVLLLRNGKLVVKLLASDVTGKHFSRKAEAWTA
jgi:hypothetical protein